MDNDSFQAGDLQFLLEKYINNTCSKEELQHLLELTKEDPDELLSALKFQWSETKETGLDKSHWDSMFETMMDKAKKAESVNQEQAVEKQEPGIHQIGTGRRRFILKIAAAAAILLVLSTAVFLLSRRTYQELAHNAVKKGVVNDVAPGGDKAILTLADGKKIVLDTASNGSLTQEGGIRVIKIGGQLSYNTIGDKTEVLYNTITTPKGGQYQLQLADGTKVWLNAASSLRFPTAFPGKERIVELSGEGYFEVKHHSEIPFHVKVNDMDVQDLGTEFNIDSYGDESNVKTTLVEGSVIVSAKQLNRAAVLKPGQQAVLDKKLLSVKKGVDVEEITAWKNGQFVFNSASLEQIMKEIARWYDVEVEYKGQNQNKTFSGIVSRNSNLSQVLNIMKQAGVQFEVQGKKITVLQ